MTETPWVDRPEAVLRRGVARSLACAGLASLLALQDSAVALVAVTLCFVWVPLTWLERWAARRPAGSWGRGAWALVLGWVVVAVCVTGADLQLQYLRGLARGVGPAAALASVELLGDGGLSLLLVWLLGGPISALVAARSGRETTESGRYLLAVLLLVVQPIVLFPLFLIAAGVAQQEELVLVPVGLLAGTAVYAPPAVGVLWALTALSDRLVESLRPAEAA